MIKSFADADTSDTFDGRRVRRVPPDVRGRARDTLLHLDKIKNLLELRDPASLRLHPLKGKLAGRWAIRVNNQWRITFRWEGSDAYDVRFEDYHR